MPEPNYRRNGLIFFTLASILNLLLFLPAYVVQRSSPQAPGLLLHLSADWLLLLSGLLLTASFTRLQKVLAWFFGLIYFTLLLYQCYYHIYIYFYSQHPNLRSDLLLARQVLPLFIGQITGGAQWVWLLAAAGLALALLLSFGSVGWMAKAARNMKRDRTLYLVLAGIGITALFFSLNGSSNSSSYDTRRVQWISRQFNRSLDGYRHIRVTEKLDTRPYQAYAENYTLTQKPNIYLLFVESYGRSVATKDWGKAEYHQLMAHLQDSLQMKGWHSASAYSVAPVLGGRSWLSFTSVMAGIQLSDHADFQELLRKFPDYPHLIRYLKQQGYGTYRLKTFAKQEGNADASYEDQERFYGFDTWVQHPDIPYQGYKYDFHGGIPDQYGLGYFLDELPRDRSKPEFLFFISMASHWPFFPPPPLTKNWRQLDSIRTDPYKIPIPDSLTTEYDRYMWRAEGKMAPRYAKAIFYDLRMMTQFTMEQVSPGSIVIIIGDHQPPGVTAYGQDGLECPVHILSQDSLFLQSLDAYGFRPGMEADTVLPAPLRHQGLYSLLVRELNRRYGSDPEKLPPYLPEGL